MTSLEELITNYQRIDGDLLWARLDMGKIALKAKREHGVSYTDFAKACGVCQQTLREYAHIADFYTDVDLREKFEDTPLRYSHLKQAKRGVEEFEDKSGTPPVWLAVNRLERWAANCDSPDAARIEMDLMLGKEQPPRLLQSHEGNWAQIEYWLRNLDRDILNGSTYRVAIYEVE